MNCLVQNYSRAAARLPLPGVGAYLECNLFDLETGRGQLTMTLPGATYDKDSSPPFSSDPGESIRFESMSRSIRYDWPKAGTPARAKQVYRTGDFINSPQFNALISSLAEESIVPGAVTAVLFIVPPAGGEGAYVSFKADASVGFTGGRWRLSKEQEFGSVRWTFDAADLRGNAGPILSTYQPPVVPAPQYTHGGKANAQVADLRLRFSRGWCLYNPGYIQIAL